MIAESLVSLESVAALTLTFGVYGPLHWLQLYVYIPCVAIRVQGLMFFLLGRRTAQWTKTINYKLYDSVHHSWYTLTHYIVKACLHIPFPFPCPSPLKLRTIWQNGFWTQFVCQAVCHHAHNGKLLMVTDMGPETVCVNRLIHRKFVHRKLVGWSTTRTHHVTWLTRT